MFLSARELGKKFGLSAMEMNHILKDQGFLSGKPGLYFPTDKAMPFVNERYFHRGNGMGGAYDRSWLTRAYNEAILKELNITPKIIENTKQYCKQLRIEQRAAYLSRTNTITPSIVPDPVKISKLKVKGPKLGVLKNPKLLVGGTGLAIAAGVGGFFIGKAIANKREKEEDPSNQESNKKENCLIYNERKKSKKRKKKRWESFED